VHDPARRTGDAAVGAGHRRFAHGHCRRIFQRNVFPEAVEAVARVAKALGAARIVEIPEAARARAAAYVISTTEGASLHLDRLRQRSNDFDPAVRDRLLAAR